jgi:uncharacterized membrane protein YphA (DoxX/SURF4 family)
MKTIRIIYWTSTSLVGLMMIYSAYSYLTDPVFKQGFDHLGYPGYFRIELAIAKVIGVLVLLSPFGARLKEWAYAGFTFVFISAFIAHTASGDPFALRVSPVIFLVLLAISYVMYHRLQRPGQMPARNKPVVLNT